MTIQLRLDVPALERLIGGDTEVEVAIQKQIVHAFCKKHLLELTKTEAFQAEVEAIRVLIDETVKKEIGGHKAGGFWDAKKEELTERIKNLINEAANKAVDYMINKRVKEHIEDQERRFSDYINRKVEMVFDQNIQAAVTTRFKAAMERMTKSALEGKDKADTK